MIALMIALVPESTQPLEAQLITPNTEAQDKVDESVLQRSNCRY